MGLFSKKLSLDEILNAIDELPEEDKAKVKAKMEDLYKAEDEREIDKIEEGKTDNEEVKDEKSDEVKEETEEIGKDVDEVKSEVTDGESAAETEEKAEETETEPAEETTEEPAEETTEALETEELNGVEEENKEDVMSGLADRVSAIEATLEELTALKDKMEEFTRKQAEKFGYKGGIPGSKKDYGDMSADELAKELRTEI